MFPDCTFLDISIINGGAKVQTSDKVKEKSGEIANKTSAGLFAKLSWLPFWGGEGSTEIDTSLGHKSNSLIKTTLSNTVLTDFLDKIKEDNKRILRFSDYTVKAYKNSIAYFKMFTPYLIMTKSDIESEGITFEAAKMDEAFKSGKGYYELVAANGKSTCLAFSRMRPAPWPDILPWCSGSHPLRCGDRYRAGYHLHKPAYKSALHGEH